MAALSLHHVIFADEKSSSLPLRSASSFLRSAPEKDESPSSPLFSTPAYQDLIQRQPTHPDGPTTGWDLGLNLIGDPMTATEHKSLEVHQIKMKLRRLHVISIVLELLFGIWGTYTTVRYCLAFADGVGYMDHFPTLVFGIMSAFAVALVITSFLIPLFPQKGLSYTWRHARLLLRASYLVLLSTCAVMNIVLVLMRRPTELCGWDIDVTWYTAATGGVSSPCHTAPFAMWITAAILRLVVTMTIAVSFLYILRVYYGTRHPTSEEDGPKYTPYLSSDPEELSPVSISPLERSKSMFQLTRSQDSDHTLYQSSVTLPKSNSISTLAPSTSCTGHSRSYSTPPSSKDITPPRISSTISRKASSLIHAATLHHHGLSSIQSSSQSQSTESETPSPQTQQPVTVIAVSSQTPPLLRRASRVSFTQVASSSDTVSEGSSSRSERPSSLTITRDSFETRSSATWKPGHRGTGVQLDSARKTSHSAWENDNRSQTSGVNSEAFSSMSETGKFNQEKELKGGEGMYSYGYGASGCTYPYLDMYNPQWPRGLAEDSSSSPEHVDARELSQGQRRVIPCRSGMPETSSEPRALQSQDDAALALRLENEGEEEQSSGGEEAEEEYVAMMGGFVRRMATIESLGSKEAAGTLSSSRSGGSMVLKAAASGSLSSGSTHFSSVRFATLYGSSGSRSLSGYGLGFGLGSSSRSRSGTASFGALVTPSLSSKHTGSPSTTYLSFSSGGTDMMQVNERGELLPSDGHSPKSATSLRASRDGAWTASSASSFSSPYERHHRHVYTASGSSLPRMDDYDEVDR